MKGDRIEPSRRSGSAAQDCRRMVALWQVRGLVELESPSKDPGRGGYWLRRASLPCPLERPHQAVQHTPYFLCVRDQRGGFRLTDDPYAMCDLELCLQLRA